MVMRCFDRQKYQKIIETVNQREKVEVIMKNDYNEKQARHGFIPNPEAKRRDRIQDEVAERRRRINFNEIYATLGYPSGRPNNGDIFFKTC